MALVKVNDDGSDSDRHISPVFDLTATPEAKRNINNVGLDEILKKQRKNRASDSGSFGSKHYTEDRPTSRSFADKRSAQNNNDSRINNIKIPSRLQSHS